MNYHNPENLTEWGQADGWRIKLEGEPHPDDAEYFAEGKWWRSRVCTYNITYRTKKPLPVSPLVAQLDAEIKAKQELMEIALAVEAGAEWEVQTSDKTGHWLKPLMGFSFEWYVKDGWQVRLKPKPRPWSKPEDVPGPVCWLRGASGFGVNAVERLVFIVSATGVEVFAASITWDQIYRWEHSTDRINWKPCETTEEAK